MYLKAVPCDLSESFVLWLFDAKETYNNDSNSHNKNNNIIVSVLKTET